MKKYIVGNWKMNPITREEARALFTETKKYTTKLKKTNVILCVPSVYIADCKALVSARCLLGAQNIAHEQTGAYTGEVSGSMLKKLGVSHVLVGHSERRALGENNLCINQKIRQAFKADIIPIFCIGEKERSLHDAWYLHAVKTQIEEGLVGLKPAQLATLIIAYEPVWAIGKDAKREATPYESEEMAIYIRKVLSDMFGPASAKKVAVLYGGSVNEKNASLFLQSGGVDGLLPGRVSLNPKSMATLIENAETSL